jgi:glycosyltransferase involved in cell wall biosynthesis
MRYKRGIERYTWSLAGALAAQNVSVDLFTWQWSNGVNWGEPPAGVRVHQMPDTRYYHEKIAPLFYLLWLTQSHYDWVIVFFPGYGESTAIRFLRRSTKVCIVFHFPPEVVPHLYTAFDRGGLAKRADQLVAVSWDVGKGVEAAFDKPCALIPNGVDTTAFQPSPENRKIMRQKLQLDPDAPMLITLAALEERKGVQWVIRALPPLLTDFPKLQYWVLGEGAYRAALEAEVKELGLADHVHLIGNVDDVPLYLSAADVGCLLSYGEAFPLTLLEYMAMALPVVTSDHPPFDRLVKPEWGIPVYEKDTVGVTREIYRLLNNLDQREKMGAAGRQNVLENYTWEKVAGDYLQVLGK